MLRVLALALVVMVAGCATSTPRVASKRTASSAPTASDGLAVVTPTPTPGGPVADLPLATVAFSCRLPVVTYTVGAASPTYQGGFISFPSGTYTADPTGTITFDQSGLFATKQFPVLVGDGTQPFYDAAAGRWVPASAGHAAPDGSSYAYATNAGADAALIHVVNVRRGTEVTYHVGVPLSTAAGIQVEDDDGSGVFLVAGNEGLPRGVWRLDLPTGSVTDMAQVAAVVAVRHGHAWAVTVDPRDPSLPQAAGRALFDTVYEVDLVSHIPTSWYYTQGRSVSLLGFASADRPVVSVSAPPDFAAGDTEVRIIDHPNTSAEDNGELVSGPGLNLETPQADGDRTWFGGPGGIYLYTSGGGLQRVFAGSDNPKTAGQITPAGFCG